MPRFNAFIQTIILLSVVFSVNISANDNIGTVIELSEEQLTRYKEKNLNILGVYRLNQKTRTGKSLVELSGLAWDEDEKNLYALSDRGYIVTFKPNFTDKNLTGIKLVNHISLKTDTGKNLSGKLADSEGLALENSRNATPQDTEFVVSFERVPRIVKYSLDGNLIETINIPAHLSDVDNFHSPNKSLEALTIHEKYGILTGPEKPFKNSRHGQIDIHNTYNDSWGFYLTEADQGALVGLSTLPDNRLIALERIFSNIFSGVSNVIHLIELSDGKLIQKQLTRLYSTDGYISDNFEGITWHKSNRFFMISDDNNSVLQKTLLVYFEILNLDMKDAH